MNRDSDRRRKELLAFWGIALGVVVGCATLGLILWANNQQIEQDRQEYEHALKVSPKELSVAYDENPIAADQKYKGHVIELAGPIANIGQNFQGDAYLMIGRVQCFFPREEEVRLAKLLRGQEVTVRGRCQGERLGVALSSCKLAAVKPYVDPEVERERKAQEEARRQADEAARLQREQEEQRRREALAAKQRAEEQRRREGLEAVQRAPADLLDFIEQVSKATADFVRAAQAKWLEWEASERRRLARLEKLAAVRLREIGELDRKGIATAVIREKFNAIIRDCAGTPSAERTKGLLRDFLEKRAQPHLEYAKKLIQAGKKDAAKERLEKLIRDFPGTKSAEEAQRLLKQQGSD
jgi:hypothetical protein